MRLSCLLQETMRGGHTVVQCPLPPACSRLCWKHPAQLGTLQYTALPVRQCCPLGADALGCHVEGKYSKHVLRLLSLSASSHGMPRRRTRVTAGQ